MIEQSVRRLYHILESYTEINLSLWLKKLKYSSLKYTLRGFYTEVSEGRAIATMETNTVQTYQLKKGKKPVSQRLLLAVMLLFLSYIHKFACVLCVFLCHFSMC